MTMTKLVTLVMAATLTSACATDAPETDDELGAVEQADTNTAVVNYCLWSSGSYWCQDYYTAKWCTHATVASGWDYTGCTWSGWSSSGTFCGTSYPGYAAGWEWGQAHSHCT